MANLIRNRQIETDHWQRLELGAGPGETEGAFPSVPADGDVLVPLALWTARRDALAGRSGKTGVWLNSNEGPEAIVADLARLPLVAINFPSIADGRGLSTARLLRERHGYKGEIRAIGTVIKDLLLGMHRCGFDSFLLRDDQDPADALRAFDELGDAYQASVVQPQPLFRRRLAGAS
jgi:uncharacterized protein (DUF934 family)